MWQNFFYKAHILFYHIKWIDIQVLKNSYETWVLNAWGLSFWTYEVTAVCMSSTKVDVNNMHSFFNLSTFKVHGCLDWSLKPPPVTLENINYPTDQHFKIWGFKYINLRILFKQSVENLFGSLSFSVVNIIWYMYYINLCISQRIIRWFYSIESSSQRTKSDIDTDR